MSTSLKAISRKQHDAQIEKAKKSAGYCFAVAVFPSGKMPKFYPVFSDLDEAKAFSYDLHKKLKNPSEDFVALYFHTVKAGGDSFGYINIAACEKDIRFCYHDANLQMDSITLSKEAVIVIYNDYHRWEFPMSAAEMEDVKKRIVADPVKTIIEFYERTEEEREAIWDAPMIVHRDAQGASDWVVKDAILWRARLLGRCHPKFREMALNAPQFDHRYWAALSHHHNGANALITMSEAYMVGLENF